MIIGVPREIKTGEQRVALTPAGARALTEARHRVLVEQGAGLGSGIRDEEYAEAGGELGAVERIWAEAELILKVKEPVPPEYPRLRRDQVIFTYLHLAAMPDLARALQKAGVIAIGYETVQRGDGSLPLLTPMSEVAGRLAVQEGAYYLGRAHGGRASCFPASRECLVATWPYLAVARPGSTPPRSRSVWALMSPCSI